MDGQRFDALTKLTATGVASRRGALRLLAGGVLAALLGRGGSASAALACRNDGAKCDADGQCCSRRCGGSRCRSERLRAGAACTDDRDCRSGICGRINSVSSICRNPTCRREGRDCALSPDCCRGVCDASTLTCVD